MPALNFTAIALILFGFSSCKHGAVTSDEKAYLYDKYYFWPEHTLTVCWADDLVDTSKLKSIQNENGLLHLVKKTLHLNFLSSISSDFSEEKAAIRKAVADTWETYADLNFIGRDDCKKYRAEQRKFDISIELIHEDLYAEASVKAQAHSGGHSRIGNNSRGGYPSMLILIPSDRLYFRGVMLDWLKSVAVHEFGHAVGFAHEHERPDAPAEKLCKSAVDALERVGPQPLHTIYGGYDPDSIMNYCAAGSVGLSKGDIAAVQSIYGPSLRSNQPEPTDDDGLKTASMSDKATKDGASENSNFGHPEKHEIQPHPLDIPEEKAGNVQEILAKIRDAAVSQSIESENRRFRVTTPRGLNIRNGPGTDFQIIGKFPCRDRLFEAKKYQVSKEQPGPDFEIWFQVSSPLNSTINGGWISAEFIALEGDDSDATCGLRLDGDNTAIDEDVNILDGSGAK
jgi:hypothetical protein